MTKSQVVLDPARPLALLADCPAYAPSPLKSVEFQNATLWIKDETQRMGLGAFKALGGVYAVARLISEAAGGADPTSEAARSAASGMTFVAASAGNHGMAVAAGARIFGAGCRIHLAETVPEDFAARLRRKRAGVVRSGATYEESIAAAIADAGQTGAVHLADGSWTGYTEPPRLVMEGYTVIAEEVRAAFAEAGTWPDCVLLQAGVGGLAGAIAQRIRQDWPVQPRIVIVEPDAASCLAASVRAGRMETVAGPVSVMGRLDCKTPSLLAFQILADAADEFVTVTDLQAEEAADRAKGYGIETTSSGAAGLAALLALPERPSNPLIILSEGPLSDD